MGDSVELDQYHSEDPHNITVIYRTLNIGIIILMLNTLHHMTCDVKCRASKDFFCLQEVLRDRRRCFQGNEAVHLFNVRAVDLKSRTKFQMGGGWS